MDSRKDSAMRARITKMVEKGWSISGRDPVRLECGRRVKVVRGGVLIDG